eukprot:COSAG01_NODE_54250_length_333_cov_1.059829_1_plen_69_part_01
MSQLPPKYVLLVGLAILSITVHSVAYSWMNLYVHHPLENPDIHVHRYACKDTVEFTDVESVQVAPFVHG